MEYNLAHSLLGRFSILIPLLGLFFEIAGILVKKRLVSYIAGAIVIAGTVLIFLASITGISQLNSYINPPPIGFHYVVGWILLFLAIGIFFMRIFLFKRDSETVKFFYLIFLLLTVVIILINNEITAHILYKLKE